jgi:hypothetical protein
VAALAWLVHAEQVRYVGRQSAADLAGLPVSRLQKHLPEAAAIGGPANTVAGGRDILDAVGDRVGTMLRTSPAGDAAIGFSGPTDLLVVCDRDLRVAGMEVLSSRDTRDHVHAVERDAAFWQSFRGQSLDELAGLKVDKATRWRVPRSRVWRFRRRWCGGSAARRRPGGLWMCPGLQICN